VKKVVRSVFLGVEEYKIYLKDEVFPLQLRLNAGWFVERDYPEFAKEILKEFPPGRYENGKLVEPYPDER
jgi:hypothetical protein